jgi:uncharacterized membrane protein YphA (DoxX/SURF4 family)
MRRILLAVRVVLGVVFLYAAYTKLRNPWLLFALSIDSYRLLPEWAVLATARTLPWFELVLGALLIAGYKLRWVSSAAALLLLAFFALMVRSYKAGLGIDCGCFGLGEALGVRTLVRDGLLLGASLFLCAGAFRRPRTREQL